MGFRHQVFDEFDVKNANSGLAGPLPATLEDGVLDAAMHFIEQIARNGVLIAIIAHGLIGISLVWDKVLLQRKGTQNLVSYVFWLGAISIFGLVLIPFGFKMPHPRVAGLGFAAGVLDLIASYFYVWALKSGEASEELAAMGGFAPVATASRQARAQRQRRPERGRFAAALGTNLSRPTGSFG